MNRHPEAKSFDKALRQESYIDGCIFAVHMQDNDVIETLKYHRITIDSTFDNGANAIFLGTSYDCYNVGDKRLSNFTILGRPITLEDILRLCDRECSYEDGYVTIYDLQGYPHLIFNWQLTQPLHEQTPKTWEKIAEII